MTAVRVNDLKKSYGHVEAVKGVDFVIQHGEVVAILGPNGAGKTSTVEMIEGFRRPDSGSIEVLGQDPGHRDRSLLDRIGIVLQSSGIEDELTVAEAILSQSRPYTNPMDVDEVIELVDLGEKRDERIKRLSGGQRRRLDLALGIVGNPDVLFLDEPTTGFDPAARRRSWQAIKGLARRGATVVLTTHYLDEAQELADRVIVMAEGLIVADGPPDSLGERNPGKAIIRFEVAVEDAATLGLTSTQEGRVRIETEDPVRLVNEITGRALENGVELRHLEVARISLEEAYLRLVGQ